MSLRHRCVRLIQRRHFAPLLAVLVLLAALPLPARVPQQEPSQPGTFGKRIWLRDAQPIAVNHVGSAKAVQSISTAQPLALAEGDFDADGVEDLVVGYASASGGILAFHRGNLGAFAPQSEESFQAIGHGDFPSPFLPTAVLVDVPVRPDFVAVGSFNGEGYPDVVVAQRGDSSIYLLTNDTKGNFAAAKAINVGGPITALASGDLGPHGIYSKLLVGISDHSGSHLMVYTGTLNGLGGVKVLSLPGAASNINFGHLGDIGQDAIFVTDGQVLILHSSSMRLEALSLPVTAQSIALGSFIWDRNPQLQIAVVDSNGGVHFAAHNQFDPRAFTTAELQSLRLVARGKSANPIAHPRIVPPNGWRIVETLSGIAPSAGSSPVLLRTRISDHGADDVMMLNALTGQMTLIAHPDSPAGATTFAPAEVSYRPYIGSPTAAIAMRVNIDGRPGIVAVHQGQTAPSVMMPLPDPTFFVNETDDPTPPTDITTVCNNTSNGDTSSPCSLREAILRANATSGTDTIMLGTGTYSLTIGRPASPDYTGHAGALYVNDSANIVGAGQNSTIIQWGSPTSGVKDMVVAVNEDINPITNATASISNLTIQNGVNHGASGVDGDGGCMEFDTGSSGAATLTLTNVTLQNCSTTQGLGGGLANFNFVVATGTGQAIISNSIIQGNSVADDSGGSPIAAGGGIWVSDPSRITMTNSQVLNNSAIQDTATTGIGGAGGLLIVSKGTPGETPETQIHSSTISGNTASFAGGGVTDTANLVIDQGTVITSNTNGHGASGIHTVNGGGLFVNPPPGNSATLSKLTIKNNTSTGTGGGVAAGAIGAGVFSIQFSRLIDNTAASTGSNLENLGSAVTATDDWWGTNDPSNTIHTTAGTTTFDPFIVLTDTSSPTKIRINQSSTLTGDMSKDNHGNGAVLSGNLDEIVGLPITFDGAHLGTIPQAQPETLGNPVPTATATFNAGGTGGVGTANATVDEAVVPVNSNLIASASESGTTATITTVGAHGFSTGDFVSISGVSVSGYNGQFFAVTGTPSATTFTYTATTSGLASSSGGTATEGIIILEPPSITKSFDPTTVPTNTSSIVTFSVTNGNVIPINTSFTDSLPSGLVVATTPGVNNGCGGTVTATAGSGTISFTNSALPAAICTVQVNVQSAVDNTYSNSVTIDSSDAGNGNTSTATLTVINPPAITKSFGATSVALNGSTSLSFAINNPNTNSTLNGITFTDNLPAGLVVATPSGATLPTTCGSSAAITAAAGSSSVTVSSARLAPGASCTPSVNVTGTTTGTKLNSVQVSSTNGGTGNTSNASLLVIGPPTITQADSLGGSVSLNSVDTLNFTITNPNATSVSLSGIGFNGTLSAGLAFNSIGIDNCGGTATGSAQSYSLSGVTLAGGASCSLQVNVNGTAAGNQTSSTSAITSNEGGSGSTTSVPITVVAPPSIAKVFVPSTIPLNGTTSLQFTITNPTGNTVSETGVAVQDSLPTGLTVTPGTVGACGGTVQTIQASGSGGGISLSSATVAVGTPCTFSVTVTGTVSGQYTNTTAHVTSVNGGQGNTGSASLTVASPPGITKSYGAASIPLNGTTTLSFALSNPNSGLGLTGVSFADTLPAGLVIASTPNLSNTCNGTATAVGGSGTVSLSAATITSSGTCAVSVNVQGTTAGIKNNSVTVNSTEGGTGNTSTASITVVTPPTLSKAFGAASIPLSGTTTLSFTVTNSNAVGLSGVSFTDTLPTGLAVSSPNGLTGSCGGGTIAATAGGNVIGLSGGSVAASSSCTFAVNVTGTAAGKENNTTSAVTSTEGGTGGTASASIAVVAPPMIAKAFSPSNIVLNGTTSLMFTITNPSANTVAELGVAFTDTLPTGLTVASSTGTACGGTLTTTAPTGIALSGASVAVGPQCTFSVTVTGASSGSYTNTTGNVTSTNGGTGNTASAGLTVATPPNMTKAFGAIAIPLNGTTSMTFNITNPNSGLALSGVQFTDSLPAGLVVSSSTATNSCGGTATVGSGGGTLSLSGGSIAAGSSCSVSATVQGTSAGAKTNAATVSSSNAGTGNTPTASITVVAPPSINKSFGASSIPLNGTTSLTFMIANNNSTVGLTGIGFSDSLPSGLVVASPSGLSTNCGGTPGASGGAISLSGVQITASSSCALSLNVTGTTAGVKNNTTSAVTSNEGGTGLTASASITVVAPPAITKAFGASTVAVGGSTSLTLTITNPNTAVALTGVAVTDAFPTGLVVASAASTTCGGSATGAVGASGISLSGGTIAAGGSCTLTANVMATTAGPKVNTTGNVSSTNGGTGNTAMATLEAGDFSISLSPNSETIPPGHMASFTLTVSSTTGFQGTISLTGVGGPPGSTLTIKPSSVTLLSGSEMAKVTIDLAIPKGASKGTSTVTVTGTSDGLTHTATATLKVGLND